MISGNFIQNDRNIMDDTSNLVRGVDEKLDARITYIQTSSGSTAEVNDLNTSNFVRRIDEELNTRIDGVDNGTNIFTYFNNNEFSIDANQIINLKPATETTLGGVKKGTNTLIDSNGVISVDLDLYTGDVEIKGDLIASNLTVLGTNTTLISDVFTTEQLEIENAGNGTTLSVSQTGTEKIFTASNTTSEVFTIKHDGKVGIGTNSPLATLHIDSVNPQLLLSNGTTHGEINFGNTSYGVGRNTGLTNFTDGNDVVLYTEGSGGAGLKTNNGFLKVASNGNVGIGSSNPKRNLDLSTTGQITFGDSITTASNSGIFWNSGTSYGIYRTNDFWNAYGDWAQLMIKFRTGIILHPGAGEQGKSHVGVVGGMSIGSSTDYYATKYNNGIIVQGDVGIGTTTPAGNLHISSGISGDCKLILESDTNNSSSSENDNPHIVLRQDGGLDISGIHTINNVLTLSNNNGDGGISFATGNTSSINYLDATERMRISVSGNVGIGSVSPQQKLDINGNIILSGDYNGFTYVGDEQWGTGVYASGNTLQNEIRGWWNNGNNRGFRLYNRYNNTIPFFVNSGGNVGIGSTNPERDLDLSNTGQITFGDDVTSQAVNSGIFWHGGVDYGIYRTNDSWTADNYAQLMIKFNTGIILNPGAGSYGRSHVGVVGGVSIGSSADYYKTEYNDGLIVKENVGIGTNNPQYKLDVVGNINLTGNLTLNGIEHDYYTSNYIGGVKFELTNAINATQDDVDNNEQDSSNYIGGVKAELISDIAYNEQDSSNYIAAKII
jgi:hypothetical protein